MIELVLAAVLARGHLLIEDLPGLGKTTLAKALAAAPGGRFARIQCTPDLLPGDITGFNVFNQQTRDLEFVPGPVFADVLLADEINRATPRTQSALLEVMAERQVTVDNVTHAAARSLLRDRHAESDRAARHLSATGMQLDRFAMKLRIGYPERNYILEMLDDSIGQPAGAGPNVEQVIGHDELIDLQRLRRRNRCGASRASYLASLGEAIRNHPRVTLGISPRGLLIWLRLAQAWATLRGRDFVTPDDVQAVALPVLEARLAHRRRELCRSGGRGPGGGQRTGLPGPLTGSGGARGNQRLPAAKTGRELVPIEDFRLSQFPAEINEPPIDEGGKVDEPLGVLLGSTPNSISSATYSRNCCVSRSISSST